MVPNLQRSEEKRVSKRKSYRSEKEKYTIDYKYIWKTARSSYECGIEHSKYIEFCRDRSHMLKHIVMKHHDMLHTDLEFRMRIVRQHKTAFERQIAEAVLITK